VGHHLSENPPQQTLEPLEPRHLLAAVPLGNLALSEGTIYTSGGLTSTVFNGAIYYAVTRASNSVDLWKTGGSSGGATLVRNFTAFQSLTPTDPPPIANFTAVGGSLYFTVGVAKSDGVFDLWKTDGTTAGTTRLTTFSGTNVYEYSPTLTAAGNTLFFRGPGTSSPTLWKSDGTTTGTKQVYTGSTSQLFADGETLYFTADGLYKVTATTTPLKIAAPAPSLANSTVVLNGVLYYVGAQSGQQKLYRYDGIAAPQELAAVYTNQHSPELTVMGDKLYYASAIAAAGSRVELWQSDGTSQGTHLLKDINPTSDSALSDLTPVGDTLYFSADDGTHGAELWKSDGTADGTVIVADIVPGKTSARPTSLTAVSDTLYFSARSIEGGYELWQSDGTQAGTRQVADLYRGAGSALPHELLNFNGKLAFQATDSVTGYGLFTTQPNVAGVTLAADYIAGLMNGATSSAVTADGRLLSTNGANTVTGRELYVSDGTAAGTSLLKDIAAGSWIGSSPGSLTSVNGTIFFSATGTVNQGNELWKTDGTPAGTTIVKDVGTYLGQGVAPVQLTAFGSVLYYVADDGQFLGASALWKSDGTDQGTVIVPNNSATFTLPGNMIVKDGALYFLNGLTILQKVAANGSGIGTLKDFTTFNDSSPVRNLALAGNYLYMAADSGNTGLELWRSDGTTAGTVMVKEINTNTNPNLGGTSSSPGGFTDLNGIVCFSAQDVAGGFELWRTNGTAAGTQLVKDIRAGNASSSPLRFIKLGNKLLFTADDGIHGRELWQTDATTAGTTLFADLNPGLNASNPTDFTIIGNLLYFTADDGQGRRLWVTDGSTSGTHALTLPASNPMNLLNVNGILYYTANDGLAGPELYKWDPAVPAPTVRAMQFAPAGPLSSLTLDFDAPVAATLRASDLHLRNLTTGQPVDSATLHLDVSVAADRATVTFATPLLDGNYQLTLPAGTVRDSAGIALAADVTSDFFVLAGDANRDRSVDFNDLVKLAQNYNTTGGKTYADADFTGDGNVNFNDLVVLAQNYNTSLPQPATALPLAPTSTSFAADWAAITASVAPPVLTNSDPEKPKPKPIFSLTPVANPVATKKAPPPPRRK